MNYPACRGETLQWWHGRSRPDDWEESEELLACRIQEEPQSGPGRKVVFQQAEDGRGEGGRGGQWAVQFSLRYSRLARGVPSELQTNIQEPLSQILRRGPPPHWPARLIWPQLWQPAERKHLQGKVLLATETTQQTWKPPWQRGGVGAGADGETSRQAETSPSSGQGPGGPGGGERSQVIILKHMTENITEHDREHDMTPVNNTSPWWR